MVKAYPIDQKGTRIGPERTFTDRHWANLKKAFGAKIAWKSTSEPSAGTKPDAAKEVVLMAKETPKENTAPNQGVSTNQAKRTFKKQ